MTTACGLKSAMILYTSSKCISKPKKEGLVDPIFKSPFFTNGSKRKPMELMFCMSCPEDSSYDKKRHRSPRLHLSIANAAARLVFPVPAVPEASTVLPLVKPAPLNILSNDGIPVETLLAVPG